MSNVKKKKLGAIKDINFFVLLKVQRIQNLHYIKTKKLFRKMNI